MSPFNANAELIPFGIARRITGQLITTANLAEASKQALPEGEVDAGSISVHSVSN